MYYYKARFYSPTLGRFMQTDPTGYDDGPNWYNYVGGDPLNKKDPLGTYSCSGAGCAVAKEGIKQIQAAKKFYESKALGSMIPRGLKAAAALGKVLKSLGTENDGGPTIVSTPLNTGTLGTYSNGTISIDNAQIDNKITTIGATLAHEAQHYRQRSESVSKYRNLTPEVRPILMEYIVLKGQSLMNDSNPLNYVRYRLQESYCRFAGTICGPAIDSAVNSESGKPF